MKRQKKTVLLSKIEKKIFNSETSRQKKNKYMFRVFAIVQMPDSRIFTVNPFKNIRDFELCIADYIT
jgi:hypothetical protein